METDNSKTPADIDWETRTLCSDESCIGVIGEDGRCKECGLPYDGDLPVVPVTATDPGTPAESEPGANTASGSDDAPENPTDDAAPYDDWEHRTLCSDGNCIGIIGPDGRCKECGKPVEAP